MTAVFPTIIAVLIGLICEEYYGDAIQLETGTWRLLLALPLCLVPAALAEVLFVVARHRFDAGRPLDFRRYAPYVAQMALPVYIAVLFLLDWPQVVVPFRLEHTVLVDHLLVLFPYLVAFVGCLIQSLRLRRPFHVTDQGARAAGIAEVSGPAVDTLRQLGLVLVPIRPDAGAGYRA